MTEEWQTSKGAGNRILMCGNEALAESAILAGCDAYFGYPITPQNEIPAYMSKRMPEEGRIFLQSESELAARRKLVSKRQERLVDSYSRAAVQQCVEPEVE